MMMQSALTLGLLVVSVYAAPVTEPVLSLPILARQDANSYALPEFCYFDGRQEGDEPLGDAASAEEEQPPPEARSEVFKRTDPVYAKSHYGQKQFPEQANFPHFHALGDSFSAGPGAGEYYGEDGGQYGEDWCFRSKGSYAYQLIANNDDEDPYMLGSLEHFQFLSCTGHVTQNVIDYQIPALDFGHQDSQMTVTLSIGGNDLGFSKVVKSCLIDPTSWLRNSCRAAKKEAKDMIENTDGRNTFRDSLFRVWNGLRRPQSNYFPLVAHTLYPTFFNAEFANCNDVRILKFGNPLTMEIRRDFNELVTMANEVITKHAITFQRLNPFAQGRLFTIDVDEFYEDHRLCEPFVQDLPGFSDPEVWFFGVGSSDAIGDEDDFTFARRSNVPTLDEIDPDTCDPDHPDLGQAWGCTMVQHNQTVDYDLLQDIDKRAPQFVTKAFHPKTAGFTATVDAIKSQLPRELGATVWSKRDVPGTDFTFDGNLPDEHFDPEVSYPINVALSGMVPCTNQIETFMSQLGESHLVSLDKSPNVVLMYDGVGEVISAADDKTAFYAWREIYEDLRRKVGRDTVILAGTLLPPPNLSTDMQTRFVNVNDDIVEYVTLRQNFIFKDKVLPVDLSQIVAGPDAEEMGVSVASLDTSAFYRMLGAWLNGATHAAINLDWIEERLSEDPNPKPKPTVSTAPEPTAAPGPSAPTCNGNDVQGDCVAASLGPLVRGAREPVCNKALGNNPTSKIMNREKARELASAYCQSLVDKKVVLNKDNTLHTPFQSDGAIDGGRISAAVLFDKDSCAEGLSEADQKVDFNAMGLDKCYEYMFTTLDTFCYASLQGGNSAEYKLLGGIWGKDCALWSLRGN